MYNNYIKVLFSRNRRAVQCGIYSLNFLKSLNKDFNNMIYKLEMLFKETFYKKRYN